MSNERIVASGRSLFKGYLLYDSNYVTFSEKAKVYGQKEQISGCQGQDPGGRRGDNQGSRELLGGNGMGTVL